jgi:hypothetical protein
MRVREFEVQANEFRHAMSLNGRGHRGNAIEFNDLRFAVDSANQHDDGFAHQGVVVYYKNAHEECYLKVLIGKAYMLKPLFGLTLVKFRNFSLTFLARPQSQRLW